MRDYTSRQPTGVYATAQTKISNFKLEIDAELNADGDAEETVNEVISVRSVATFRQPGRIESC